MGISIEVQSEHRILCVRLTGELDIHSAEQVRETISEHLAESRAFHLVINFEGVTFMDSAGLGVLIGRYKQVRNLGGELYICHLSPPVKRLYDMSGMSRFIPIAENETEAFQKLGVA
ncbi:MAG: anti-sigma F factor antagonist [Bacilli bacterium]